MNFYWVAYIKKKWAKIIVRIFFLFAPIAAGLYIVLKHHRMLSNFMVFYEDNDTIYLINTVFIIFVLMSFVPIFINMLTYFRDSSTQISDYKGAKKSIKTIHNISSLCCGLLTAVIFVFLTVLFLSIFWHIKILKLNDIVLINGYLSIGVFTIFLGMDILAWKSGQIMGKESNYRRQSYIKKSFAKESILLINVPTLVILSLSVFFLSNLGNIDYFKSFFPNLKHIELLYPVPIPLQNNQKAVIELFPNGIETGIIMTSIIYSQILYFVLTIKWDYIESRK